MKRKIKETSSFARGNGLAKHKIRIISPVHEGEGNRVLKRVCAWCCKVMEEGRRPVTHGICPECEERELSRYMEETKARAGVSGRTPLWGK